MGGNGVVSWRDLLLITGNDVLSLLDGRETQVIEAAERAYALHTEKRSSLPPAVRLGFPDNTADRIIAIPAYLGGELNVAGVKWIASVPENVGQGMERAHALMILNERRTGRPVAILEGSIISARRTAASAALAAKLLTGGAVPQTFGFVGCGPINFEVSRFLSAVWPQTRRAVLLDLLPVRAEQFQERLGRLRPEISCRIGSRLVRNDSYRAIHREPATVCVRNRHPEHFPSRLLPGRDPFVHQRGRRHHARLRSPNFGAPRGNGKG
jgi:ornithine cyclodeaminase/alanine dehydrogenase-like protein (mu-crystallin family)